MEECKSCNKISKINISIYKIIPFDGENTKLWEYFNYFLYKAPNIESDASINILKELHEEVFNQLIEVAKIESYSIPNYNARNEKALRSQNLFGNELCLKCKRMIIKRKKHDSKSVAETNMECLLRHIRNSIAHSRVYVAKDNNCSKIIFEDAAQRKGPANTRIVCVQNDLKKWKEILSRYQKRYPDN